MAFGLMKVNFVTVTWSIISDENLARKGTHDSSLTKLGESGDPTVKFETWFWSPFFAIVCILQTFLYVWVTKFPDLFSSNQL